MRVLPNLLIEHLFDKNEISLFDFLKANAEQFAYTPSTVLVAEKEVRSANITSEDFLIGYVDLDQDRYVMTASDNGYAQMIRFYRIEENWVSYRNQMYGGGIYGVYKYAEMYPALDTVLNKMLNGPIKMVA